MPILVAIIIGVLVISGGSYFGYTQFKKYQTQQTEREKKTQEQVEEQQKSLEEAKLEIEKLKEQSVGSEKKQQILEQKIKIEGENKETSSISSPEKITSKEVQSYLTGVAEIICYGPGSNKSEASASLWNFGNDLRFTVLTNDHAIPIYAEKCYAIVRGTAKNDEYGLPDFGVPYTLNLSNKYDWNTKTDVAVLEMIFSSEIPNTKTVDSLNYGFSLLPYCSLRHPLNSPVVVIGYPAFSKKEVFIGGLSSMTSYLTITEGVITAHDSGILFRDFPDVDYFVSAKIDAGSSGGIALSKSENGQLCVLGIPTWLSLGTYETQGIIQSIHNVFYSK